MSKHLILNYSEIEKIANLLLKPILAKRIITLQGELGTGKTTLVKAICKILKVHDEVTSPSYNILNIYESSNGPIYHYDLYRLKNTKELYNLALDEAFENYITIIEWPELAKHILTANIIKIKIRDHSKHKREYIIDGI